MPLPKAFFDSLNASVHREPPNCESGFKQSSQRVARRFRVEPAVAQPAPPQTRT
jgi:hypothetical protein